MTYGYLNKAKVQDYSILTDRVWPFVAVQHWDFIIITLGKAATIISGHFGLELVANFTVIHSKHIICFTTFT